MSRMATNEYIGAKRRMYTTADRKKRIRILDEVCETTGYERKYANRLLTGNRKFRERKGRGKTYGEEVAAQFAIITDTINKGRLFLLASRLPNTGHCR